MKVFYSTASRRELEKARMTLWDLAKSYQGGIILLIRHGVAPTRRQVGAERFALVGFCYYGDLVMTVSDKPLKAAAAGDSPVFPPPIIKGETLRFLDRTGEGMCVYWDGRQYSWYPIEPQD